MSGSNETPPRSFLGTLEAFLDRAETAVDRFEQDANEWGADAHKVLSRVERLGARLQSLRTHEGPAAPRKGGNDG